MAATSSWTGYTAYLGAAAFITRFAVPQMHPAFGIAYSWAIAGVARRITSLILFPIPSNRFDFYIEKAVSYTTMGITTYGAWKVLSATGNTLTSTQAMTVIFGAYLCAEAMNYAWQHRDFFN